MTREMAPVQKTYGGYKPKRRGIPNFILKESIETRGIFPALHIDNLKVIKGAASKYRSEKRKKPSVIKEYKPTFDLTLDSTFDKIVKSTNLGGVKQTTPGKCLTCGCIPADLGHHALFECKKDPFYLTPQSNGVKRFKKRQKRSIKVKEKRPTKQLFLKSSPVTSTPSKAIVDFTPTSVLKSDEKKCGAQIGMTSTPNLQRHKLTFGVTTSPIHLPQERKEQESIDDSDVCVRDKLLRRCPDLSVEEVELKSPVKSIVAADLCPSSNKKSCIENDSGDVSVVESSLVLGDPSKARPSTGYITKRRRWRRNRYVTPCNVSADMFASVDKCSRGGDCSGLLGGNIDKSDASQVIGRRSTCSYRHSAANLVKEDIENVSTRHISDLSDVFCKSLNLQAEQVREESAERSDDIFSGLSLGSHKKCAQDNSRKKLSGSCIVIKENSVYMDLTEREVSTIAPLRTSILNDSTGDSVIFSDCSLESPKEIILKPCYVKLYKCDFGTVADVTFTSQTDVSVCEDNLNESSVASLNNDEISDTCLEQGTEKQAVVTVPLELLGKLDKVSLRNNRLTLESSFLDTGTRKHTSITHLETEGKDCADAETSHRSSIRDGGSLSNQNQGILKSVLSRCDQTEPLPFESCYPESMLPYCKKIGEGAYGEVFLHNTNKKSTVIKIIPVEGAAEVNGAVQKKLWEIRPEIVVAQELNTLRQATCKMNCTDVFNEVFAVRCVRGKYPKWMLDLWHKYDEEEGSENDCPDMFGDDQLFIVLELANGGRDLESYTFTSADQAVSALVQIVFALAVAESEIQFEHRDLHWGNILVAPSNANDVFFTLQGTKYKVASKGVKVSVIDFTMSRMTMPSTGEDLFYDFGADEDLFAAQGDYQCDIYRLMRERTKNDWAPFEPFTNILWLHYVVDKMCTMVAYRSRSSKLHQEGMRKLKKLRDAVLAYPSAMAFAQSDFFKASRCR